MRLWIVVALLVLFIFIGWQLWHVFLIGLKEPTYTVLQKKDRYEIRKYDPYLIAHVSLLGSYKVAINKGFSLLATYIFGENKQKLRMPMTVPVFVEKKEKAEEYDVAFVMPAFYKKETLPEPNDSRVEIKEKPSETVAAYRFSGYPSAVRVEQKKNEFEAFLKRDDMKVRFPMILARYNPPWVLPFLMRNELLVVVDE